MTVHKKRRGQKRILIKKYGHFLQGLTQIPGKYRQKMIQHCPKEVIDCVGECCLNIIKGNVKLNSAQKQRLRPRKNHLLLISSKKVPVAQKKKIINQKGNALLGLLLKTLIGPVIGSILSGALANGGS